MGLLLDQYNLLPPFASACEQAVWPFCGRRGLLVMLMEPLGFIAHENHATGERHDKMPRHVTKTYGRQAASCSRVFDDVVRDSVKVTASQTSSTIRKWGETSFTSKRNAPASLESAPRKRKSEEIEEFDEESESIGDGIFSDPFSFDEEDDGPKKPKKGVKAKKEKKLPPKTYRILSTKNNKPEVSMFKNSAPSKTYTQVGKPTLPRAACAALPGRAAARKVDNQQMTMDSFTLKMTKKSSSMPAVSISGTLVSPVKLTAPPVEISSGNDTETEDLDARWERAIGSDSRKFFSSKDHDYSHSPVTISSEDDTVSSKKEHNYYQCSQEETKPESDWDSDSIFGASQSVRKVKLVRRTVAVEEEEEKKVVAPVPSVPSGKDTSNGLKKMKKIELRDNESRSLSKKTEEPLVRRLLTSPKKKEQRVKASYNPRQWHGDDEPPAGNALSAPSSSNAANRIFDDFDETDPLPPVKLKTDPVMRRAKTDPGQRHYSYKDPSAKVTVSKESKPKFYIGYCMASDGVRQSTSTTLVIK
ncbi:hypothetical protein CAPTEDRAFT_206527 [Capitella teleta]|uniref:Uncharacterized protein n=1 Tax=Capitella teleta TaxID=283909 RepID=R7U140_CAPTE|nr:hypothetical protein CAPTEDRAFT_206527 [Capitella teleta]|eukprot:ELT99923.1 hypothetical protein CAPTEDRAFT_206527 [Capitella teleta]